MRLDPVSGRVVGLLLSCDSCGSSSGQLPWRSDGSRWQLAVRRLAQQTRDF